MPKFTIRKTIDRYFNRYGKKYFILLLCFIIGLTIGTLYAGSVNDNELHSMLEASVKNIPLKSNTTVFIGMLLKNLRIITIVFFSAWSIYTLPIFYLNIVYQGVSIGFTAGVLTFCFGKTGFVMAFLLLLTQLGLSVPIVMFASVTGIECTLHNTKCSKTIKKCNRRKFLLVCLACFIVLCLISIVDSTIIFHLLKTVSAFI